jgi:hypothetical protein
MLIPLSFPVLADETAFTAVNHEYSQEKSNSKSRIVTSLGTIYVGMPEEGLYRIFQDKDRILLPHEILDKKWLVFNNWMTNDPNDTITFYIKDGKVTGWENKYEPAPENKGSIYQFDGNANIGKWFFPPGGEARWDSSKMSLLDWHKLVTAQKIMYLKEYIAVINKRFSSKITIDMDKYIRAMDYYADNCSAPCNQIPLDTAVNNLLIEEGKAKGTEEK